MNFHEMHYPIDKYLDAIFDALNESNKLIIKAETGAGKTTRLPSFLATKLPKKILVLEPRRLAAKMAAQFCAETLKDISPNMVGYHIRFEKNYTPDTKLVFITEGLFVNYLKNDPLLNDYSCIIIDEFHERSIHTDIALSLVTELQKFKRPDLKLIVMSATLDIQNLESFLDSPKTFEISGRKFPITIENRKSDVLEAIEDMLKDSRCTKNILVFFAGLAQINKAYEELTNSPMILKNNIKVARLHSSLSKKDQEANQKIIYDEKSKTVILSTNIAETSVTLPNITGVIDLGIERRSGFAPWSGMPTLEFHKTSKASSIQRAGRAGRIEAGIVYQLFDENDFNLRESFTPPEVQRIELSKTVLDLCLLLKYQEKKISEFNWFESPNDKNYDYAINLLELLNALKNDAITTQGEKISRYTLPPRLSAMICNEDPDQKIAHRSDQLLAACVLSEGSILINSYEFSKEDHATCDLSLQCDLVKASYFNDNTLTEYHLSISDRFKVKNVIDLFLSLAKVEKLKLNKVKTSPKIITESLLKSFCDRIAQRGKGDQYNFTLGRGGKLSYKSSLIGSPPPYLVVLDAIEDLKQNAAIGTKILQASSLTLNNIENSDSPFLTFEKESNFNEKKGVLSISTKCKHGKLTLKEITGEPVIPIGHELVKIMTSNWPWPFSDDSSLLNYNIRAKLFNSIHPENQVPVFEQEMFSLFIESIIDDNTSYLEIKNKDLNSLIEEQLSYEELSLLNQEVPTNLDLAGRKFVIDYSEGKPFIKARFQNLYSLEKHPTITKNKIPIIIKILSPADRVMQVVSDIMSFWQSSWPSVKKEMKARYPKHNWEK